MLSFLSGLDGLNPADVALAIYNHLKTPNGPSGNSLVGYDHVTKGFGGPAIKGDVGVSITNVQIIKKPGPNEEVEDYAARLDCSNWLCTAYRVAGHDVGYVNANATGDAIADGTLKPGDEVGGSFVLMAADTVPEPGFIVLFRTHMGIVVRGPNADGVDGLYVGSQGDSGLAPKEYGAGLEYDFSHPIGYLRPKPGTYVGQAALLNAGGIPEKHLESFSAALTAALHLREIDGNKDYGHILAGNDILKGTAAGNLLYGGNDQDKLFGFEGNDTLAGGSGHDVLNGGAGSDTAVFGGANITVNLNVKVAQNTGQGFDTLTSVENVTAGAGADKITGNAGNNILNGGAGKDQIQGGLGHDSLDGGAGDDLLDGGAGNDLLVGGLGNDLLLGDFGNDVFRWMPGHGRDTMRGGAGQDRLEVIGAAAGESLALTAGIGRAFLTRTLDKAVLNISEVERIDLKVGGGADTVSVGNLAGTGVKVVRIDLAGASGTAGDGAADTVVVHGSTGNDTVSVAAVGGLIQVAGLAARTEILNAEAGLDQLVVNGGLGNDVINASLLPGGIKLTLNGGVGNDNLTGSAGADKLIGGAGNDTLAGGVGADTLVSGAGADTLIGGLGNDVLNGGVGNDLLTGGAGNDTYQWLRGDGTDTLNQAGSAAGDVDVIVFGAGIGRADLSFSVVDGTGAIRIVILGVNGGSLLIEGFTGIGFPLTEIRFADGTSMTRQEILDALPVADPDPIGGTAGDDTLTGTIGDDDIYGLNGDDVLDGGDGNDILEGGAGDDRLDGGEGNDALDGGGGADTIIGGEGDDLVEWDSDGNDVIDGGEGVDRLRFYGDGASNFTLSADGGHAILARDMDDATLDLTGVEEILISVFSGADTITVGDLTGTDVREVTIDLNGDDNQADLVVVDGTDGDDTVTVTASVDGIVTVGGLAATIHVKNADSIDGLLLKAGDGNDTIDASTLSAGNILLQLDGGAGDDTILGSQGNDVAFSGLGDDDISLGAGHDAVLWTAGDGNDTLNGGIGSHDLLTFKGDAPDESVGLSATDDGHVRVSRDVDNAILDLVGIEEIFVHALGGADTITIGDLTETDVTRVVVNLAGASGLAAGADGAADTVVVHGADGGDDIDVTTLADGTVVVAGLGPQVQIRKADGGLDRLVLNGSDDGDHIDAEFLQTGLIQLTLDGGAGGDHVEGSHGADTLIGGEGDDLVIGNGGNDTVFLGAGDDTFWWEAHDDSDVIDGGDDLDDLIFDGNLFSPVDETITLSAGSGPLGGHALLTCDVEDVILDLDNVEHISIWGFGGADTLTIGDLTGTDVSSVYIDLSSDFGNADHAVDTIVLDATGGDDQEVQIVIDEHGSIRVTGLAAEVTIGSMDGFEAHDSLIVNGGDGQDVLDASGLAADLRLTLNGGAGEDTLTGSAGSDTLIGGAGSDVFRFDTPAAADTIEDFTAADDTIALDQAVFTALGLDELAEAAFHVLDGTDLTEDHRILYDQGTGELFYDADGSGAAAAIHFATLLGNLVDLTHADFVVV